MPKNKNSAAPLIKGYLPVRLTLPPGDETFFFVKEHFASDKATLFVANVPSVPGVSSRILLQSLFGRFGSIERVTVIENPRNTDNKESVTAPFSSKKPSFLGRIYSQGRFAHVVFLSSKEMKKSLRELSNLMSSSKSGERLPGLSLERLEIQTLSDESKRQASSSGSMDSSDEGDGQEEKETKKGIHAVAERYRASRRALSREALLEECNAIMEEYEDAEEAERKRREASKSEPDEDGFITVSYSSQSIGSKRELEQGGRRKGSKRSRKKKDPNQGLTDFYRFQTKESRKKGLQDLRKRFEQDLAKVKKMKEERQYRPF
jgi:ribosomal RNA-processing protein 7